jgi:hypothetical protein
MTYKPTTSTPATVEKAKEAQDGQKSAPPEPATRIPVPAPRRAKKTPTRASVKKRFGEEFGQ